MQEGFSWDFILMSNFVLFKHIFMAMAFLPAQQV